MYILKTYWNKEWFFEDNYGVITTDPLFKLQKKIFICLIFMGSIRE